jgi:hypothetical protein
VAQKKVRVQRVVNESDSDRGTDRWKWFIAKPPGEKRAQLSLK